MIYNTENNEGYDFSFIVPVYKGQKHIDRIINMIQRNKGHAKEIRTELIFVDDYPECPIDDINGSFGGVFISTIHNDVNTGIHRSRITGAKMAQGYYVCFLDQDDIISDNYLRLQLNKIGEADLILCNGTWRGGQLIYTETRKQKLAFDKEYFLRTLGFIISPGQIVLKRTIIPEEWTSNILKHNGNDDSFLWTLLVSRGVVAAYNKESLYEHVDHADNSSFNWKEMIESKKETLNYVEKAGILSAEDYSIYRKTVEQFIVKYTAYERVETCIESEVSINKDMCSALKKQIIAIYGMGIIGKKIKKWLSQYDIGVQFAIDANQNAFAMDDEHIYGIDERIPRADLLIVTPVQAFNEVRKRYNGIVNDILPVDIFLDRVTGIF